MTSWQLINKFRGSLPRNHDIGSHTLTQDNGSACLLSVQIQIQAGAQELSHESEYVVLSVHIQLLQGQLTIHAAQDDNGNKVPRQQDQTFRPSRQLDL